MFAYALVVHEEKELVFEDWPAKRSAEDVLRVLGNRTVRQPVGPAVGVEILIL